MKYLCSKCNNELIKCLASGWVKKFSVTKLPEKIFSINDTSEIYPYVCFKCGYTEWYADKPENLK